MRRAPRIVWSQLSLNRISEIADYIAQDNASAAKRWVDSIFAKVKCLQKFPESGRVVPETKKSDIRELIHGNYRIIYGVRQSQIAILTVRHGKQRLPKDEIT
ncbi:MAG: type II toxin-antitoxin system RelE/ParE family toxin [Nitrospirota bacterium]